MSKSRKSTSLKRRKEGSINNVSPEINSSDFSPVRTTVSKTGGLLANKISDQVKKNFIQGKLKHKVKGILDTFNSTTENTF